MNLTELIKILQEIESGGKGGLRVEVYAETTYQPIPLTHVTENNRGLDTHEEVIILGGLQERKK